MDIAAQLEENNQERQRLERQIAADCAEMIRRRLTLCANRAIVLVSANWNLGVVGIVASRLAEKYSMRLPAFFAGRGQPHGLRAFGCGHSSFPGHQRLLRPAYALWRARDGGGLNAAP